MKIAVIGTGYVGLVTGACLSDFGHDIICVDNDHEKIMSIQEGNIPIFEPGLDSIIIKNVRENRLGFTTNLEAAVRSSEVIFIAVGTPPNEDGSPDLSQVKGVAAEIAQYINEYKVIVNKSTVPVGTGSMVKNMLKEGLLSRGKTIEFDTVSNPEFLREGAAVYDFTHPDRVVIGCESQRASDIMKEVYRVLFINETPFISTNLESAELIKYASNAFLAMKITFINEVANLCEQVGANIKDVSRGIGKDGRIGGKFLHAGPGYGGSCFPKDTKAFSYIAKQFDVESMLIDATIKANEKQKSLAVKKIKNILGDLTGKTITVLGLSFKPNTDDMREAPSISIVAELSKQGVKINAYDPIAQARAKIELKEFEESIVYYDDEYSAMNSADAVVIITEWNQFRNLDFEKFKTMVKQPILFDLRNIYNKNFIEEKGIRYFGTGQ